MKIIKKGEGRENNIAIVKCVPVISCNMYMHYFGSKEKENVARGPRQVLWTKGDLVRGGEGEGRGGGG